jgi:2-oxoglutarate dehydrogenase E2 component (dihydrolipoamide succinyltransferase)
LRSCSVGLECDALRAHPAVNSSIDLDAGTMTLHHYGNLYGNLGIAVDVEGQGLMAPVVKDAGNRNLRGMARAIRCGADDARGGRLKPDDFTGSTFTISNPGRYGTYASAAIINQPDVGIIRDRLQQRDREAELR